MTTALNQSKLPVEQCFGLSSEFATLLEFQWTQIAQSYDWSNAEYKHVMPELLEILGNLCPSRVLELGCGTGVVSRTLARHGVEVFAVDRCQAMLERARALSHEKFSNIRFVELDFSLSDFCDHLPNTYDVVVFPFSIEHQVSDRAFTIALSNAQKLLFKGSSVVMLMPHPEFQLFQTGDVRRSEVHQNTDFIRISLTPASGSTIKFLQPKRSLQTVLKLVSDSGLQINELIEINTNENEDYDFNVPSYLIIEAQKD